MSQILSVQSESDMKAHPQFGRIWEIFVTEQLIRHFKNNAERIEYFYYRTHNQAEVDLILDTDFGLIPVEIKASSVTPKKQLSSLENFIEAHNCPYGLVINNGDEVFKLSKSVYQLPAIFL